jgi:hypothetical protein
MIMGFQRRVHYKLTLVGVFPDVGVFIEELDILKKKKGEMKEQETKMTI